MSKNGKSIKNVTQNMEKPMPENVPAQCYEALNLVSFPNLVPWVFWLLYQNPRYPRRKVERRSQNLQLKFLRGACLLF